MDSADFAWAVMAIRIQREVGGNLAELLHDRGRDDDPARAPAPRRRALTAEGKISAIVLGILPVGLGVVMYVVEPRVHRPLFETTLGNVMLGAGRRLDGSSGSPG